MPDADKAICEREHRTKREKYLIQLKEFRNRLPPQRIDDFESTYGKKELYQLESAQNKINLNQETN